MNGRHPNLLKINTYKMQRLRILLLLRIPISIRINEFSVYIALPSQPMRALVKDDETDAGWDDFERNISLNNIVNGPGKSLPRSKSSSGNTAERTSL